MRFVLISSYHEKAVLAKVGRHRFFCCLVFEDYNNGSERFKSSMMKPRSRAIGV